MSLSLSNQGDLIAINSSADLFNINIDNGNINWATNTSSTLYADETDFFKPSDIVINNLILLM